MKRTYEIIHQCKVGAIVRLNPPPDTCEHEWKEVYYGVECVKCKTFYPHGSEPWAPYEETNDDTTFWD